MKPEENSLQGKYVRRASQVMPSASSTSKAQSAAPLAMAAAPLVVDSGKPRGGEGGYVRIQGAVRREGGGGRDSRPRVSLTPPLVGRMKSIKYATFRKK